MVNHHFQIFFGGYFFVWYLLLYDDKYHISFSETEVPATCSIYLSTEALLIHCFQIMLLVMK